MRIPEPRLRHQDLILSLYGLYARQPGEALPVAAIIRMLGSLGYEAQGVRSAVSRLKAKGLLIPVRNSGVAGYALAEDAREIFDAGDDRIFAAEVPRTDGEWVLAVFSVPESKRNLRHRLRTTLSSFGFGTVGSGLWIAPLATMGEARKALERRELSDYVEFFGGRYLDEDQVARKIGEWWDLPYYMGLLDEFLDAYGTGPEEWADRVGPDPMKALLVADADVAEDAFRYYVPMLTMWRRLPYRVPLISVDLLPPEWNGPEARAAFTGTHELIQALASRHAHIVIAEAGEA